MIGNLNHVGVATPSIEDSIKLYRDILGATKIGEPFDLPAQGVKVCFVDTPTAQIELIEPREDIMIVVGGVIPPSDVQPLLDMGAAAVYPPGSVIADTAIDLIEKLNERLGYAQPKAESK